MTDTINREVRTSGDARALRIRRTYDSPIESVWDACTRPDRLRRWFAEVSGELKLGGTAVADMTPDIRVHCRIEHCEPPTLLRVSWDHPGEAESLLELRLAALAGGGTELALEHRQLAAGRSAGYGPGWEDFLQRLDAAMRGADPSSVSWADNEPALTPIWAGLDAKPLPGVATRGETGVLTAERHYASAPDQVWSALTDPARLTRWFATVSLGSAAEWTATFTNGRATGTIRTCESERLLVTSWRWDHEETESELTMRLEATQGGTLLRLRQAQVGARSAVGYAAGWYAHLAGLASHLDGADPAEQDWDHEFAAARQALREVEGR